METEQEPGFDLNYPVPLLKELPSFSGSGLEPGSITRPKFSIGRDYNQDQFQMIIDMISIHYNKYIFIHLIRKSFTIVLAINADRIK